MQQGQRYTNEINSLHLKNSIKQCKISLKGCNGTIDVDDTTTNLKIMRGKRSREQKKARERKAWMDVLTNNIKDGNN
jgi:hypothetical protein